VVWNRLYEPYARELDLRLTVALGQDGLKGRSFNAALLFEPEDRMSRSGRPFVQFAAYWRSCLASSEPDSPQPQVRELRCAAETAETTGEKGPEALQDFSEWEPQVRGMPRWEPGETGAQERLERFVEQILAGYDQSRDLPGIDGTSTISPHLHFGEIGPRQAWYAVRRAAQATTPARAARGPHTSGAMVGMEYLRQLGWREFAHYLLYHFPYIVTEPFRPEFARFPWEDDPDALDAWKRGATGYPLVDAGMRQLLAEGWMHNRVRMVVASFLTKDLLIPWQQGAAWFWDRLVDADLANNTLGWQWTAGSGPDAAPYFRIFNPVLQARRFDPDGTYLRLWLPEAPDGPGPLAHPRPLVDHGEARARALAAFRGISRPIGA
jgi:deoxyribodipyrimidine photo-lyase